MENGQDSALNPPERDYSKYTQVPRLEKDLYLWMHPKIAAHIQEVEGLAQYLLQENFLLKAQMKKMEEKFNARLQVLEARLLKNSSNSNKPPSSDSFKKNQSLRKPSGKKPGGQSGHKGAFLKKLSIADQIEIHPVTHCQHCHQSLDQQPAFTTESRQVFDLPKLKLQVTQHQIESKICPQCSLITASQFPEGVTAETQYGINVKSLVTYLLNHQLLPYQRTAQLFEELFEISLSVGTLANFQQELFENLKHSELQIKQALIQSDVAHFDETPIRCEKKQFYIHVACTEQLTHLYAHPSRGLAAVEEIGILPLFKGIAAHDGLPMYFTYMQCRHTLCNVHLLRDLKFIEEVEKESWAGDMKNCLMQLLELSSDSSSNTILQKIAYLQEYDGIIQTAWSYHRKNPLPLTSKQGKPKQRPGKNLADRFFKYKTEITGFLFDSKIPFSNNCAERAFRMEKVKQKISGCFRNAHALKKYCRIRSYLSSCKKQGLSLLEALTRAFEGRRVSLTATVG